MPTGQPHSPNAAKSAQLSQFMIAKSGPQLRTEFLPKLGKALARAVEGGIIAHTEAGGVAAVVAVGDDVIAAVGLSDELVQQMVLAKRVALPDEMPVAGCEQSEERIGDLSEFIII